MQIAFALIAVFWWIAIWGLSDLLTEDWSRTQKFELYVAMLMAIGAIVWMFPSTIKRF
jgi:hypothetical protein